MFGRLFDERFRSAAAGVYAYSPYRLILCVAVTGFIGLGVGWQVAFYWASAAMAAEAALLVATRRVARAARPSVRRDWTCAIVYALTVPTWSVSGLLLWSSPSPACHLAAFGFFAGHLLYMQAHHAHSPGAALPVLPSMILPAVAPIASPHFHGVDQLVVCLAMGAVAANSLMSLGVSLRKSKDLLEAQAAREAASQAKSEFLARMSHEIRTPLNGVLGMTQALAFDSGLKARHRQSLAVIRQSGESLLSILNDVLDLSKIEAGRLELETIAFDLESTVRGAQETFAPQAAAKGLAFRLHVAPEAAGTYLGDPTRVRQILYNLLSNAVKFTGAGEVSLHVRRAAQGFELEIADTGIGIAREDLSRLFSRFQQVDSSTTRRYGGSGLGLSICRELAELMGGSVTVESAPGAGTRFTVALPLPCEASLVAGPPDEAAWDAASRPVRVLAAEDNPVNQLVLRSLLAEVGVEPHIVADGEAAVAAWRAAAWDVILMDIQMPVMDGLTAARAIRAAEAAEGRPRTPIVALTADAMRHQVEDHLEAGLDGHLAKPIDARRLFQAIAEAVDPGGAEPDAAAEAAA